MPSIQAGWRAESAQRNESATCHAYSFTPLAPSSALPQSLATHAFDVLGLVRHVPDVSASAGVGNSAAELILQHQSGTFSATLTPVPFDQ